MKTYVYYVAVQKYELKKKSLLQSLTNKVYKTV